MFYGNPWNCKRSFTAQGSCRKCKSICMNWSSSKWIFHRIFPIFHSPSQANSPGVPQIQTWEKIASFKNVQRKTLLKVKKSSHERDEFKKWKNPKFMIYSEFVVSWKTLSFVVEICWNWKKSQIRAGFFFFHFKKFQLSLPSFNGTTDAGCPRFWPLFRPPISADGHRGRIIKLKQLLACSLSW